ncbi:MAG: FAD-binding oxidoreductase [Acidimicrobiia bacterium]
MRLQTTIGGAPEAELTLAPKTANDVADILRYATEKEMKVQVWGGGTRQGYGLPPPPDIVLSTEKLKEVEAWEPDDLTLVVGAGAKVAGLEAVLAERNQTAALPEVPGDSTIGGVIATGTSSLRRGRLYPIRDRVLEATAVTADGHVVRSGGRVVKNVTGYDLHRLHVGAFGSLGVVVSVCLKLWPVPPAAATVTVADPAQASVLTRPLAVLEENNRTRVFVWGRPEEVEAKVRRLGGEASEGHDWPADPAGDFRWSLRVPPALTSEAVARLPRGWRYLAVHGVGDIRTASDDAEGAAELRSWAESHRGHLVVVDSPPGALGGFDPWGRPPPAVELQRRLIAQFDPARVINPGRLAGGL